MSRKVEPLLTVKGLSKKFGDAVILDGVNLVVRPGQVVALRGRNGAGKSTLLRCIAGLDEPTGGTIEFNGAPLDEREVQVRRDVAMVLDDLDFFPDLSVVEHLDLLARAHGVADADELVDDVLHQVGLIPQSAQLPSTLSSGQRRRFALASVFVRPRKLLLLDEPEARLDVAGVTWLRDRLLAEKADGLAVLMASHDPVLTEAVADRIIDLDTLDD